MFIDRLRNLHENMERYSPAWFGASIMLAGVLTAASGNTKEAILTGLVAFYFGGKLCETAQQV